MKEICVYLTVKPIPMTFLKNEIIYFHIAVPD